MYPMPEAANAPCIRPMSPTGLPPSAATNRSWTYPGAVSARDGRTYADRNAMAKMTRYPALNSR